MNDELILNTMSTESQCSKILKHCRHGRPITSLEATLRYGITSLHRRLSDLKKRGYIFRKEWVTGHNNTRYIKYYLKNKE